MRLEVTKHDAEAAIQKICQAGYNVPKDTDPEGLASVWRKVLENVEPEELRQGVDEWLKEGKHFFPRPGEIRKHALSRRGADGQPNDLASRYLGWEQTHEGPCPVCGGGLKEINGRWQIVHKPGPHDAKGIRWAGHPYREAPEPEG